MLQEYQLELGSSVTTAHAKVKVLPELSRLCRPPANVSIKVLQHNVHLLCLPSQSKVSRVKLARCSGRSVGVANVLPQQGTQVQRWWLAGRKQTRHCLVRAQAAAQGTPVPKDSMLVVGSTGTLGRQVVRKALDAGYDVRCTVRPRQTPADFLRDWGATTVQVLLN